MNARPGASSEPAMHKDDNYEMSIGPLRAKLRVNHDAAEITARLQDRHGESVVRATVERSTRPALGASLRLASDTDTDMVRAGVYLGRMRLTVGARGKGLRAVLSGLGVKRRLLSAEVYRWDDEGVVDGATCLQAHLWSQDEGSDQRHVWLNVTDKLWGRRQHTDKVLEEREVEVWLPEATYPATARLVERTMTRPRSPFQRFCRFVEFYDCAAVVPRRKSDSFAHIDDGRVCVEAQSIEQGLGVITGRILQDRRQYGGARWANSIPPREKWLDSHKVSLTSVDRVGGEMAKGYSGKSFELHEDLPHGPWPGVLVRAPGAYMRRDEATGGLLVGMDGAVGGATVWRRSALVPNPTRTWMRLFPGDIIRADDAAYVVHFSPIGPPPVNALAVANLTSENKGPAVATGIGRMHLRDLQPSSIAMAKIDDPEWVAANPDIVRRVEAGERFINGQWRQPGGPTIAEEFGYVEQDVAAAVQDLAAHPPEVSPSEEAEGAAAREYMEFSPGVQMDANTGELVAIGKVENGPYSKVLGVANSGEDFAAMMASYQQPPVDDVRPLARPSRVYYSAGSTVIQRETGYEVRAEVKAPEEDTISDDERDCMQGEFGPE